MYWRFQDWANRPLARNQTFNWFTSGIVLCYGYDPDSRKIIKPKRNLVAKAWKIYAATWPQDCQWPAAKNGAGIQATEAADLLFDSHRCIVADHHWSNCTIVIPNLVPTAQTTRIPQVAESNQSITNGPLATWDTSDISGLFAVQLQVVRSDQVVDSAIIQVTVK